MFKRLFLLFLGMVHAAILFADEQTPENQTPTVSKVFPDTSLPFRIRLEKASFELPIGVQSYMHAIYGDKWLLITGRSGGLHGFVNDSTDNFPVKEQNTLVFVIDPINEVVYTKSLLDDPFSGLTRAQVDYLSVTAAQGYQSGNTLYITGGYGVDSSTGRLDTKNVLTAIDVPGLIHWVVNPSPNETAAQHIRQIFDDVFKVTGGYMNKSGNNPTLLIMGHEFNGFYHDPQQQPPVFQKYTEQVRRFNIHDDGTELFITKKNPRPAIPNPSYRRRDLNVVPVVKKNGKKLEKSFSVLSGVFTLTEGIWTVPVEVTKEGNSSMADPDLPGTFKQAMNGYDCATFGMYSEETDDMYIILLGGMSFGFFENKQFKTDSMIPFINQTTTIKIDHKGKYSQYLMRKGGFPTIISTTVNAGKPFLFGSECEVFLFDKVAKYRNDVLKFDKIKKPTVIGLVVGGIMSTLPNTDTQADSMPSKFIFKVIVEPVNHCTCH